MKGFFMDTTQKYLTPPAVGRMLGVNADKVVAWINSGKLRATNESDKTRPRWRVSPADLQAFMTARSNQSTKAATLKRRSNKPARQWV
jgi:hypothetical protein